MTKMRLPVETTRPLLALALLTVLLGGAIGLAVASQVSGPELASGRETNRALVLDLRLTDLALWSEAAYCRHPTQADRFAAWGDHPAAFEHFPAGSIVPPPRLDRFPNMEKGTVR
jgi:hypothetical protein